MEQTTEITLDILSNKVIHPAHAKNLGVHKKVKKPKRFIGRNRFKRKRAAATETYKKLPYHIQPKDYKAYIRSGRWRRRRIEYYTKFGRACVICGVTTNTNIHHVDYKRLGHELDEDLVLLCEVCHKNYHDAHGVRAESRETTNQFIIEEQESAEFAALTKNF